jgi:hypothetical protein
VQETSIDKELDQTVEQLEGFVRRSRDELRGWPEPPKAEKQFQRRLTGKTHPSCDRENQNI